MESDDSMVEYRIRILLVILYITLNIILRLLTFNFDLSSIRRIDFILLSVLIVFGSCFPPFVDPELINTEPTSPKKLIHPTFRCFELRTTRMS